jgi:hypothetical protein
LEVTVLKKVEGLPQNRSCFFEEVMGKLKSRDDFTVLHIVSIDQFFDAQVACRVSVGVPCFYTLLFRSINSLMPRLHAESL